MVKVRSTFGQGWRENDFMENVMIKQWFTERLEGLVRVVRVPGCLLHVYACVRVILTLQALLLKTTLTTLPKPFGTGALTLTTTLTMSDRTLTRGEMV